MLMLGRILGGVSTSLLFSAFESWLVAEHFKVLDYSPVNCICSFVNFVISVKLLDDWFCLTTCFF